MSRPKGGYKLKDGTTIPGVTTIIGGNLGWSKGALMHWAWKEGKEGRNFRDTSEAAADAGTLAHAMAEADIKGSPYEPPPNVEKETLDKAETAYLGYLDWKKSSKLEIVESELPLISEEHAFGGTIDAIGKLNGKLCLIDFKTSNGVYEDHLIQLAAYNHLCMVNGYPVTSLHLGRFTKEHGDWHHHAYADLSDAWKAFLLLRELSMLHPSIKGRL